MDESADKKIWVGKKLVLDPRFQLDFDEAFADGPARPHGLAFK